MVLPNVVNSISIVILGIGGIEFICAQMPYSMKGLMVGTVYGSVMIIAGVMGIVYTCKILSPLP